MGRDRAFHLLDRVLDRSRADETEAILITHQGGLTRFADSHIHQNVAEEDATLLLRVAVDGRVAGLRTNRIQDEDVDDAARRAVEIARRTPPDPDFPGLPGPSEYAGVPGRYSSATAEAAPLRRAEAVRVFVDACAGASTSGALETGGHTVALANSRGVRAHAALSRASLVAVVQDGEGSGFASALDTDLNRLDLTALGAGAAAKARTARDPVDLDPGVYPVVLEAPAVSLMLRFLAAGTFGGRAVLEGRSALSTRLGQSVADPRVQIWDDPLDPRTIGLPFDFEGVPKRRLDLVRDGVAVGVAHDLRTGRKAGRASTGHALPAPNPFGPIPTNLLMAPGTAGADDLIASTDRGILVTRFHYVRFVHPVRTVITGMTRDGTFLIEGGRITRALKNLRFNQGILDALSAVEAIGREGRLVGEEAWFGPAYAPPIKVRAFTFTGRTLF